jgi:hypothetical protein
MEPSRGKWLANVPHKVTEHDAMSLLADNHTGGGGKS